MEINAKSQFSSLEKIKIRYKHDMFSQHVYIQYNEVTKDTSLFK